MEGKMRASMAKKSLIIGSVFLLFLLMASNASSEVEPVYAGWTVGDSWDDGSGTSYGTILRSTDSGETWTRQGADQIADVDLVGVFAVDPYTAWVVGNPDNGYATIYHTTDGGITWERKGSADDVPDIPLQKVHAAGDDVWVVGFGRDGQKSAVLHTSDGGTTWTNHIPSEYENVKFQGVYALDSETVWVTGGAAYDGQATILKTIDGGQNWTRQGWDIGGEIDHILGISAADADTAWAVGGDASFLLKTIDGGETWTNEPNPQGGSPYDLNEVYAVSTSTVWVAGDFGIYWSTDGGLSWDKHNAGPYIMGVSAVSSQEAWASGTGTDLCIYHTTDSGTTWTRIDQLNGVPLPGMNTISFATRPITDYLIDLMVEVVAFVEVNGYMNKGQGNALIVKLEHALDHLINDRRVATVNVLGAFSNQVEDFIQDGVLPSVLGWMLIDRASDFIELISSSL